MFNYVFLPLKPINELLRNDCRNAKLYFQMKFSLSSTSSLLNLPINRVWNRKSVVILKERENKKRQGFYEIKKKQLSI